MTDYFSKAIGLDNSQTAAQPVDYFSKAIGLEKPQAQEEPKPKQEGWGEWVVNSVRGRQDPKEAATGTVFEQFPSELGKPTANAAIFGASDAGMADVIKNNLGDRFIRQETDANGYPVIVSRGANGQEQRGYVNKPGLDLQDVSRAVYGSLPYMVTGGVAGVAGRGAGIGVNALLQGGAAGATSVAGDVAASHIGSEQGVDLGKAGIMAGFGAAGPVVSGAAGALWRKFVTIPGYLDKSTGQLTAKGLEAAKAAGIDPADISPDFAQSFAKAMSESGNAAQAATQAATTRYGMKASRGQLTKDPQFLTQEEGMRRGLYGEQAKIQMRGFDEIQNKALEDAALGSLNGQSRSVVKDINPIRQGERPAPGILGENAQATLQGAREEARAQERSLWPNESITAKSVETTAPDAMTPLTGVEVKTSAMEAAPLLKGRLQNELAPYADVFSPENTPVAYRMGKYLNDVMAGRKPTSELHNAFGLKGSNDLEGVRKALGQMTEDAATAQDKTVSGRIYQSFNDWVGDAAEQGMLNGDPDLVLNIVKARAFSKDVRNIFQPRAADGTASPASKIISKLLDSEKIDSGEAVVKQLFGSGSSSAAPGTVSVLKHIKTAFDKFAPETGEQAWNDIRLAYWSRVVSNKTGEVAGPQRIVSNIESAFNNNKSVMDVLYTPKEQAEMRTFLRAVKTLAYKPPNASGSGYSAAQFAKEGLMKFLDSFGVGRAGQTVLNYTGVGNAWNAATARQAVSGAVRPRAPNLTPAITSAGQAYNQSR